MNIFQRIGTAIKSFIGKRITGTTTKNRITKALRGYAKTQRTRRTSLLSISEDKYKDYRNKLASNIDTQIESIGKFLNKGKIKHLRTLTEKELVLFENIYDIKVSDSHTLENLKTFDEMSSFKQMLLTTLKEKGVNIYDPRELYEALEGHTPEEIYEAWEANNIENESFYEEWVESPEDVLDKIFNEGIDKSVSDYNNKQTKLYEDLKEFF